MYYTQEQINRANQADLVSFLQSQGEQLTRAGNEYRWKRHDSLTVRGNKWYRHSQSKGGGPVDFVMEFFGKSFTEAVELLTGEKGAAPPPDRPCHASLSDFRLPPPNNDNRIARNYLTAARRIDDDVTGFFFARGDIYEDAAHHNAVFVGRDEDGIPRYAHSKGTAGNFRLDVKGSDKAFNISQKTAIMLEHFMNVTRHKIGGRAKAMVVTPSRLHAVRYVQEFKRQIKEKGLNDLEVLVAFSGEVKDNDDVFTEEGMNKDKEGKTIKEKALPETFHADDYGILVVAEKYQTGFDEPLLHTMFVDKKLSGVKAVQTLSRLNRTTRGKVDTFVLDFVNSAEDIKASFEPFYEETVLLEETDPNVVYDMKNTLDDFRVYQKSEVDKFADIFYQNENQSAGDLGKLQGQLRPAIDRYEVLEVEKQDIFKSTLASFNRVYAYITQVCRLFDKDIHRFSIYSKFLYTMLPKGHGGEKINIDDKVLLEYYKLEKDFEGPIELESTEGGYTPISGDSGHREPKKDPLTVIIDKINEKYGTHFTEMDKVLVQMENDYANQEKWQSYAKNNDRATFMLLFEKDFPNMAADRYEQNDQFFRKLFDDPDMMRQVMETVGSVLYERLKKKYIFDPKSGVIEEATPETYVEDTYLTKK